MEEILRFFVGLWKYAKGERFSGLLRVLTKSGKITKAQANKAKKKAQGRGVFVGEILVETGLISKPDILRILAKEAGSMPHLKHDQGITVEKIQDIKKDLSQKELEKLLQNGLLPVYKSGQLIVIATAYPSDRTAIRKVRSAIPRIELVWCDWSLLAQIMDLYQGS